MAATDEEILLAKKLDDKGEDITGVRMVQDKYVTMASSNYKIFMIVDRDQIDHAIEQLQYLKENLKPVDEGKNQFAMTINTIEGEDTNDPVYMAEAMKNVVIDGFKGTLPALDDQLEAEFAAIKAELEAL